jgi:hypothetical protein
MAVLRPHPKRSPSPPANQDSVQSKTLASGAVRANVAFAGGPKPRDEQPTLLLESDLSDKIAVGDHELDAIIRLLGGALDDILSGTGHD